MSDAPLQPAADDGDDDVAVVTAALDRIGPKAAAAVRALRTTVWLVCGAVGLTGLAALALGAYAWAEVPLGLVLAALAGLPAVGLAIYVALRTHVLAEAITHPREVIAQAKDLAQRAKGSPELHRLALGLRRSGGAAKGAGRLRRAVRSGRTISAVIGLAHPDPKRHALLVPFTPERMRLLWLAILAGFWWWLGAAVMALLAFVAAVASTL